MMGVDDQGEHVDNLIICPSGILRHREWGLYEVGISGPDGLLVRVGWQSRLMQMARIEPVLSCPAHLICNRPADGRIAQTCVLDLKFVMPLRPIRHLLVLSSTSTMQSVLSTSVYFVST